MVLTGSTSPVPKILDSRAMAVISGIRRARGHCAARKSLHHDASPYPSPLKLDGNERAMDDQERQRLETIGRSVSARFERLFDPPKLRGLVPAAAQLQPSQNHCIVGTGTGVPVLERFIPVAEAMIAAFGGDARAECINRSLEAFAAGEVSCALEWDEVAQSVINLKASGPK